MPKGSESGRGHRICKKLSAAEYKKKLPGNFMVKKWDYEGGIPSEHLYVCTVVVVTKHIYVPPTTEGAASGNDFGIDFFFLMLLRKVFKNKKFGFQLKNSTHTIF